MTIAAAIPIAPGPGMSGGKAILAKASATQGTQTGAAAISTELSFRARWQLLVPADLADSKLSSFGSTPGGNGADPVQPSLARSMTILTPQLASAASSASPAPSAWQVASAPLTASASLAEPHTSPLLAMRPQQFAAVAAVSEPKTAAANLPTTSRRSAAHKPSHSAQAGSAAVSPLVPAVPASAAQASFAPIPAPVPQALTPSSRPAQSAAPAISHQPSPTEMPLTPNSDRGDRPAHPLAPSQIEPIAAPSTSSAPDSASVAAAGADPRPALTAFAAPNARASAEEPQEVEPRESVRISAPASTPNPGGAQGQNTKPQSAPAQRHAEPVAHEDQPPSNSTHPSSVPSAANPAQHVAGTAAFPQPPASPHAASSLANTISAAASPLRASNPANSASPVTSAGTTAPDTIAALDTAPAAPPATWVHTDSAHAEAGYLDPSLGWVGVRADAAGSMLHATIVPSSPEAAQVLGSHLAGLNTYLADHHGAAAQLSVAAPESSQSFAAHSGLDASGQHSGQQPGQDGQPTGATQFEPDSPRNADAASASLSAALETYAVPARSGGHISVIA